MDEASAERCLRDLIGLMALPALWVGRDGATVLRLMSEAVERVVALEVTFVDVPFVPDLPRLGLLHLGRKPATPAQAADWQPCLEDWRTLPMGTVPARRDTPAGPMQVLRLSMGYSARDGSVWFAASEAGFPSVAQVAFLRAAATLAATGLRAARIAHEREEASRAKDQFLAMLGHELRNPLAPIVTSMAYFKLRDGGALSGHLAIIDRQVQHLCRLVDDLLDVTRITRGKVDLQRESLPLRAILARAAEAAAPLLDERRHTLETVLPQAELLVLGDATRLVQVFSNLLTNAAKYTDPGGRIRVEVHPEAGDVEVVVEDNGRGIDSQLMPRLFTIFEQGVVGPDRLGGGLGIGLALVKNLVELHGGSVRAASEGPGTGSRFTVRLPRLASPCSMPAGEADQPAPPAAAAEMSGRLLLVDDNVDFIDTMAMLLTDLGFEVATAVDPLQALEIAARVRPQFVLMDLGLPVMDGYRLAAEMRRQFPEHAMRLIAVSGYGQASDRERSATAGFYAHLVKPVAIDELLRVLQSSPGPVAVTDVGRSPG